MPTYPVSPQITVDALLRQPERISRDLVNLVSKRLIGDKLFLKGDPRQVAGGAIHFQRAESIYVDDDPEEIAARGGWPRSGWSEDFRTDMVHQYGFEVPIANLSLRRHSMDQIIRAERKLANRMTKYIDSKAITVLTTDADVQTANASADWVTASTDIIGDIAAAQEKIEVLDNGYAGFEGATLILNTTLRKSLLGNTGVRAALPREGNQNPVTLGMVAPILGLKEILFTPQLGAGFAILMDTTIAGTIADEVPDPSEGFASYQAQDGTPPVWVKVYDEQPDTKVIAAGRWPAMVLTDPGAVVVIDIDV